MSNKKSNEFLKLIKKHKEEKKSPKFQVVKAVVEGNIRTNSVLFPAFELTGKP